MELRSQTRLLNLPKNVREIFGQTNQLDQWRLVDDFKVMPGTGKIKKITTPKDGVGIADIYIYPEKSLEVEAQFAMINKLFSPSFFNELRTNQQLGYAVFSLDYEIHDYPAIGMTIVSDKNYKI